MSTTRLYLGNLSATVDEYSLIQLCAKWGKVSKLDYLYHKTGIQRGKPRGFAFVEFSTAEEATIAIKGMNDKLFRGRKMMVTNASEQSSNPEEVRLAALSGKGRAVGKSRTEATKPTTISLLKGQGVAGASTDRKIQALEAKLNALRKSSNPSSILPPSFIPPPRPERAISTANEGLVGMIGSDEWLESLLAKNAASCKMNPPIIKVDLSLASLPKKPNFEGFPVREV